MAKKLLPHILAVIFLIGAAFGIYSWSVRDKEVSPQNNSINQSNNQTSTRQRDVSLFYYNKTKDMELGNGNPACDPVAVLPVQRTIPFTNTPIQDVVRELIKGNLTQTEKRSGFETEFPHQNFEFLGANLSSGILTLEFSEVPGFTNGGTCRVRILSSQIEKTAEQFPEVKEVRFKPDTLFQP